MLSCGVCPPYLTDEETEAFPRPAVVMWATSSPVLRVKDQFSQPQGATAVLDLEGPTLCFTFAIPIFKKI